MKNFLLKILVFFFLVVVVDVVCGYALDYMAHHAKGGFTQRDTYICDSLDADVLLMGSSRCVRHYNPKIITDSLSLSCYNSGQDGNGIILNYGRIRMIDERRKPKIVVYDINPSFDLYEGYDNHRYLTWLKQHYNREGIAEVFERIDATERYKMKSQMYRYNSRIIELMVDFFYPIANARSDGFAPLMGDMDRTKIRLSSNKTEVLIVDSIKRVFVEEFIDELKGSRLYFVVSPSWYGSDGNQYKPIRDVCEKYNIPFIDFSNDPKYLRQDKYFKDGFHMNAFGADEFTKDFIKYLK